MVPLTKDMENVYAKPAPAPLPGADGEICARLLSACTGHPHALIPWPHRLLHDAVSHISDLTRRLAEAAAERAECQHELVTLRHTLDDLVAHQRTRAESAEARVQELEATIDAMAEAHAHDDMALTAAYLSGAHAGKKQAEAERDALREALIQIDHHASQNRVWAGVDGWKYAGLSNVAQKKIHGITQAALATEVKP